MAILNLAGYRFVPIEDLSAERGRLKESFEAHGLKGTLLIASEGINAFFSGPEDSAKSFADFLISRFGEISFRQSWSETQPFKRCLVRIKKEIIRMNWSLDQARTEAEFVEPEELKSWLDSGEDVVLLDTRKSFENELGSFQGAVSLQMQHFSEFPRLVEDFPEDWRDKKIVTFCTGGIRCEKAAPYLATNGFHHVYQLRGGILGYFEKCGGAHWNGKCFVFDHRVLVDTSLKVSEELICRLCNAPYERPQSKMLELGLYMACPNCLENSQEKSTYATA